MRFVVGRLWTLGKQVVATLCKRYVGLITVPDSSPEQSRDKNNAGLVITFELFCCFILLFICILNVTICLGFMTSKECLAPFMEAKASRSVK